MAIIDLRNLQIEEVVTGLEGQKIMVYGSNDTGKTKQLTKMPKPLLLMTETGGNAVRCAKVPVMRCSEFKQVVTQLTNENSYKEMREKFQTIIIDTAEQAVQLFDSAVCAEFNVRDLSEIEGKRNGYTISRKDFAEQINRLTSLGYTVVFIAHETKIEKTDPRTNTTYTQYIPKGSDNDKSSMRFVRDLCDFVIFTQSNGINSETSQTIPSTAICKETKEVFARSRYDIQTHIDPFNAKNLEDAIKEAIKRTAEEEESTNPVTYEQVKPKIYTKDDLINMIKPYVMKLGTLYPSYAKAIVEEYLGVGSRISEATDQQVSELEVIYNKFVTFATSKNVEV